MNHNDIVIYGFNLGNSDPSFKEFVYSLSNYDIHNLRMILYKQLYKLEQNGVSAALHGRDSYGIIIVPEVRKTQLWAKSDKLLFNYIKDLWVASVLGFTDPSINPIKNHQWRITRIRAVTTRNEGWEVIASAVLEMGVAYIGLKGLAIPRIRILKDVGHKTVYNGVLKKINFDLSKKYWSGFQIYNESDVFMRIQIHRHTLQEYTQNSNRYLHYNIEFPKHHPLGYQSNRHFIFDKDYLNKKIREQWLKKK